LAAASAAEATDIDGERRDGEQAGHEERDQHERLTVLSLPRSPERLGQDLGFPEAAAARAARDHRP
jgi:hypothetical protein